MSREHRPPALNLLLFVTFLVLGAPAPASEAPAGEFTAKAADYDAPFGEASAAIKQIILDEGFEVVGVADFTDLAGQPLQIGRLYAEEFATRLVGPRKKYRLLDPATLLGLVEASGGPGLWATPEKIRQFGDKSKVELVVTGRIEIAAKEARFFIKAIATDDAGVVWARTIAVPGVSAAAAAAAAEAAALAAQAKLVAMPISTEVAPADALGNSMSAVEPAAATGTAAASGAAALAVPAAAAAAPAATAPAPAASTSASSASAPSGAIVAAGVAAAVVSAASSSPAPEPTSTAASSPPAPAKPAPSVLPTGAVAAPKPVVPAVAAATTAAVVASAGAPAAAPVPKPGAVPVALPAEVLTFENAWLRARVRSASKYEGSGWVTAVLDLTNLSDRPIKLDAAQDDPGKGVDELGNNWRIERVSGLKLASGAGTVNTMLNPSSTVSVVVVLATSAQPSGRRLSFGPNLYWFGSPASGDSGRVAVAFSNIRVN
jgi:hypothetical protein